jgi:sugar-specific transcriptional regulator TrmB
MAISEQLKASGLRENEIRVYLYLLSKGLATPPQIAQGTGIARPNCYKFLESLKEKGLIAEQTKGKRKAFIASDPSALVYAMQGRTDAMSQLLPDLRALYAAQKNKPSIRFFDGAEQVKELFYEMLEAKEVFGVASTKKLYTALTPEFFKTYIKKMRERNILLKDILTKDSVSSSAPTPINILKGMYEYRVLSEKMGDIPVDILIWNNKVAFLSIETPIFGTLIESAPIAQMMKTLFELSWQQLTK